MSDRLALAVAAIDTANAEDPNRYDDGRGLALVQGELASRWADRLTDSPAEPVVLAVRAHHLKRWEIERSSYPEGRAGYLRWRRDNKAHQADSAGVILAALGYDRSTVQRVQELLRRKGLGSDPDTQLVEDSACLVFLETQFDAMVARLERDHLVRVVAKTLAKMSPEAVALTAEIELSDAAAGIVAQATAP